MAKPNSFYGDPSECPKPKPTDFDTFLPWACREYSIEADVFVTKAVQKPFGSGVAASMKTLVRATVTSSEDEINSSTFDRDMTSNENTITIETYYNSNENLVQLKFLNNKAIPRRVMQIIALTLPYQPHLTSITINKGLRMDCLYEISMFLPNSNITELCLDSTFISEANYHILLPNSKLKHLSLARCTINDAVVKTITDELKDTRPASRVLAALNLSSNRITDVGAKYLADMLRTNRQLCYLNLAGNMITDEGGIDILDKLHEFPLHAQEVFESRIRYMAYLKQKNDLISAFIIELQTAKLDKSPKKRVLKKGKLEAQSLQRLSSLKGLTVAEAQFIQEKAEYLAETKLGLFDEPFSSNNINSQDGVVHCFGNNTLHYLNIAYNNLSYVSLKKLHEVLSYQNSLKRTPRGLIKVVIEGNLLPVACKEYEEIDRLLGTGAKRPFEPASKKKPLSSRSTATTNK